MISKDHRPPFTPSARKRESSIGGHCMFVLGIFLLVLLNPTVLVASSSGNDEKTDSVAAVTAPSGDVGQESAAALSDSEVVQQQCACPDLSNSTLDWSEIIRDKVESIEALNSAAKEKVQTTLSNMERLEHALSNAAMYGKEVATLELKLNELMEEVSALKNEKKGLESQNANLSEKLKLHMESEGTRQKECTKVKEEVITLKSQLDQCQSEEKDSAKQRDECYKSLEEEKINSGKLLSKESERASYLNEQIGECKTTLKKTEKDLQRASEESDRKLKLLQSKHVESERHLNALQEEVRVREEHSGKHYCNATAMRNDLDAAIDEWSTYIKTKAVPAVERGLQTSQQMSKRALMEADTYYKSSVKQHIEGPILEPYHLHVEPHIVKATAMIKEISDEVISFLKNVLQKGSHLLLQQLKKHDEVQQKLPKFVVESITIAESHPHDTAVKALKAFGYLLALLILRRLVFALLLGPIFVLLGMLVYLGVELPLHLIHWTIGLCKRTGTYLSRRLMRLGTGKPSHPPLPPRHQNKNLPTQRRGPPPPQQPRGSSSQRPNNSSNKKKSKATIVQI